MSDDTVHFDAKGLEKLIKAFKGNLPSVRVGVLSGKMSRNGATTNAEVGAAHEFGTSTLPRRSFLRVPISDNLQKYLDASGLLTQKAITQVIKTGTIIPWMKEIGIVAERIVQEGFATGGFGKWAKWKTKGYENNTGQVLIDSQQLRGSITSEVET